jgi:phage gp29-like protein
MLIFLVKQFERMSAQAMQRSLGILKVTFAGGSDMEGTDQSQLDASLATMSDRLTANNMLVEDGAYTVEVLKNVEFSSSYREIMDYFNKELRIGVVGQNLTSEVKGGSLAAAQVHQETLESYWKSDARELSSWINDQLLRGALELNFGEQDSDDLPKWRSSVFSKPDTEGLKLFLDYGGRVDGQRIADTYNVPVLAEEGEEVVLEKLAPPPSIFGQTPQAPDPTGATVASAVRSAAAVAGRTESEEADAALQAAFESVMASAAGPAREHFGGWAEQVLDRTDPKAERLSGL